MSDSATLTVTLTPEMAAKLAEIAAHQQSTPDTLAAGAVADLIDREAEIVAAIERGRAEIRAGGGIPHEQVVREIREFLDAARAKA